VQVSTFCTARTRRSRLRIGRYEVNRIADPGESLSCRGRRNGRRTCRGRRCV
jgi:hypothetical protein